MASTDQSSPDAAGPAAALMSPEVALDLTYFQPDGIHPNARAQPLLLDNVWVQLTPLLRP